MISPVRRVQRTLLTYGRFDLFQQDHIQFLRQLSVMGDELIVGCATDAFADDMGQPCQMRFDQRRTLLESCRFVSRVIPEYDVAQKRTDIVNYNVAALVMGSEYQGHFDTLNDIAQVIYLPRANGRMLPLAQQAYRETAAAG